MALFALESPTINDSSDPLSNMVVMKAARYKDTYPHGHRLNPKAPAPLLGDHSVSDPPDPFPNSAVKPDCADDTVAQAPEK